MRTVPFILALLVLLSTARGIPAQERPVSPAGQPGTSTPGTSPDTLRLSLGDCVGSALDRGEEMRRARATRSTAHARYLQARSSALPQLTLSNLYTRQIESVFGGGGRIDTFEPDTNGTLQERVRSLEDALPNSGFYAVSQLLSSSAFASKNSWNAAMNLRQKITQGGEIWASIAAAQHAMNGARLLEHDAQTEVVLRVRQAYLNALLADRGVRISRLGFEQAELHLQRVQLRQESGSASEFELLQSEVERDNQDPLVRQALSSQEVAYLELRRLCNLPPNRPIALSSPFLESGSLPENPAAVDTTGLMEAALQASGIAALEQALAAREHAITVAAADKYPEIAVFGNLSQQAYPNTTLPKRGDWRRDINAGVSVSWNLFDGFLTKGAIEEAKANASNAKSDLVDAREMVRLAVIQGRWELERAAAELHARSRTVELAQRALELANLRYDEGASSLLEVSDTRIAWQVAQTHEAQARRDYFAALALLERYTDRPLFSALVPGASKP